MNVTIVALLVQDALYNGAIYTLLALTLVMVFSVTRVILIPLGDLISQAGLSLAALEAGQIPGTIWLLAAFFWVAALLEALSYASSRNVAALRNGLIYLLYPAVAYVMTVMGLSFGLGLWGQIVLTLLIVAPIAVGMYRVVFLPLGSSSVLTLLIAAMAVHLVLSGAGLFIFGAEGVRTQQIAPGAIQVAGLVVRNQILVVLAVTLMLMVAMAWFFGRTLTGKALRATAFNRVGARLVGIRPEAAGSSAFLMAGVVGAVAGVLMSSITTIYYDTGFLVGLKGFVAAILGGLGSYPLAALGALLIGGIESASSFLLSTYKDAIVFALILPILFWRNLGQSHHDEDEE